MRLAVCFLTLLLVLGCGDKRDWESFTIDGLKLGLPLTDFQARYGEDSYEAWKDGDKAAILRRRVEKEELPWRVLFRADESGTLVVTRVHGRVMVLEPGVELVHGDPADKVKSLMGSPHRTLTELGLTNLEYRKNGLRLVVGCDAESLKVDHVILERLPKVEE